VESKPARKATRRRSFRRGLRQRNPLVLAGAAAACLLVVLGVQQFFFGGGMTGVSEGRLLRITHDDYVHVAYKVNQLKKRPPQHVAVYIFGGSGAMETVVGERSFAREIASDAGEPATVVSLANHAQSLAQNLVIVDNLPRGRAVLLIGLAPMRFNGPPEADAGLLAARPLLLRSPRLAELAPALYGERAPLIGGIPGAFDYISAYLQERVKSGPFPGVPLRYDRHYYGPDAEAASPLAKRATLPSVWRYNREHYAANHEYNLAVLRELLRLAQEKGFSPVLFDQPLNTIVAGDWAGVLPKYRAEAERIAAEYDVPYLHIERSLTLRDDDFADLYHLMPPARARWQTQMAVAVAALLRATR
jgi:hypothetical protein